MKFEYVKGSRPGGGAFYQFFAGDRVASAAQHKFCRLCGHYVRNPCRPEQINECPELRHGLTVAA